eukprot:3844346-Amphidinium_carterae.1
MRGAKGTARHLQQLRATAPNKARTLHTMPPDITSATIVQEIQTTLVRPDQSKRFLSKPKARVTLMTDKVSAKPKANSAKIHHEVAKIVVKPESLPSKGDALEPPTPTADQRHKRTKRPHYGAKQDAHDNTRTQT